MEGEKKRKSNIVSTVRDFFAAHENIRQIVVFTLVSLICFAIEYVSFTVLVLCLRGYNEHFQWFLFEYTSQAGGTGAFIAFLVSNVLAQLSTFVLNRKKTFRATNNVIVSGIMFALMMIAIILLNTYLGGVIGNSVSRSLEGSGKSPESIETLAAYAGKLTGSLVAFVLSFLGNKFLVMRNWGKGKKNTDNVASDGECADLVAEGDVPADTAQAGESVQYGADAAECNENTDMYAE